MNIICALKKSRITATSIKSMKVNNRELTHPIEICNAFNTYFCSIGQKFVANGFKTHKDKPFVTSKKDVSKAVRQQKPTRPVNGNLEQKLVNGQRNDFGVSCRNTTHQVVSDYQQQVKTMRNFI